MEEKVLVNPISPETWVETRGQDTRLAQNPNFGRFEGNGWNYYCFAEKESKKPFNWKNNAVKIPDFTGAWVAGPGA